MPGDPGDALEPARHLRDVASALAAQVDDHGRGQRAHVGA